jgi:hypothetical protein
MSRNANRYYVVCVSKSTELNHEGGVSSHLLVIGFDARLEYSANFIAGN